MKKIMFAALAATLLAGCYKVDIFWTNHPETARIILTTDWSKRSPDAAMPDPYGIHLLSPDLSWMVSETRFEIPNLFEPGTYTLQVCNAAENIRLDGTIASLYWEPIISSRPTRSSGDLEEVYYFYQTPGYFFWGSVTQTIEADRDYEITVPMRQITRPVEVDLTIIGAGVQDFTSCFVNINGAVDAWDCEADKPVGQRMIMSMEGELHADNRLTGATRMLGVVEDQTIEMTVELLYETENDSEWIESYPVDLTEEFRDFNTGDRTVPLVIETEVVFPPR